MLPFLLKGLKYQSFWQNFNFNSKKYLMIKKEQFNNICPSTMEYSRARGCIFTKILTILSLGRHCALSLWIWILARLDSLEFPMFDLNQVFNLLSVEKDLSASQLETGSVFTIFSMENKFGNIEVYRNKIF